MGTLVLYTVIVFSVHAGKLHDPSYAMTRTEAETFVTEEIEKYGNLYTSRGLFGYPKIVERTR